MELTLEEFKQRLASQYSEQEIIDLLEIDSFTLVEVLSEYIEEHFDELKGQLDDGF
ncbi:MAG: hypothetical protein JHC33_01170 [Ignisphaera sp.]|jgi:hypothetical protein|nr:hypothetical protein [Ignisphaera sp.]